MSETNQGVRTKSSKTDSHTVTEDAHGEYVGPSEDKEEPDTFEESVRMVGEDCNELLIEKQKDYGPKNILSFGELGVLVRLNDKVERLKNLLWKKKVEDGEDDVEVNNESIEDTWQDIRNYAQIALMLRRDQFDLPLEDE